LINNKETKTDVATEYFIQKSGISLCFVLTLI